MQPIESVNIYARSSIVNPAPSGTCRTIAGHIGYTQGETFTHSGSISGALVGNLKKTITKCCTTMETGQTRP